MQGEALDPARCRNPPECARLADRRARHRSEDEPIRLAPEPRHRTTPTRSGQEAPIGIMVCPRCGFGVRVIHLG